VGAPNGVGRWNELFGSILGEGNSSIANFTSTRLSVALISTDCIQQGFNCTPDPGLWSPASTDITSKLSAGTGEQNNMLPAVNYGPGTTSIPGVTCPWSFTCQLQYLNTAAA
jgi:hypothetical protein